nr:uncharacterized protein LOC127323545 isoform X1 [Lolium perenne]
MRFPPVLLPPVRQYIGISHVTMQLDGTAIPCRSPLYKKSYPASLPNPIPLAASLRRHSLLPPLLFLSVSTRWPPSPRVSSAFLQRVRASPSSTATGAARPGSSRRPQLRARRARASCTSSRSRHLAEVSILIPYVYLRRQRCVSVIAPSRTSTTPTASTSPSAGYRRQDRPASDDAARRRAQRRVPCSSCKHTRVLLPFVDRRRTPVLFWPQARPSAFLPSSPQGHAATVDVLVVSSTLLLHAGQRRPPASMPRHGMAKRRPPSTPPAGWLRLLPSLLHPWVSRAAGGKELLCWFHLMQYSTST